MTDAKTAVTNGLWRGCARFNFVSTFRLTKVQQKTQTSVGGLDCRSLCLFGQMEMQIRAAISNHDVPPGSQVPSVMEWCHQSLHARKAFSDFGIRFDPLCRYLHVIIDFDEVEIFSENWGKEKCRNTCRDNNKTSMMSRRQKRNCGTGEGWHCTLSHFKLYCLSYPVGFVPFRSSISVVVLIVVRILL